MSREVSQGDEGGSRRTSAVILASMGLALAMMILAGLAPGAKPAEPLPVLEIAPPVRALKYSEEDGVLFQVMMVSPLEGGSRAVIATAAHLSSQGRPILDTLVKYESELGSAPIEMHVGPVLIRATPTVPWLYVASREQLGITITAQ